MNFEVCSAQLQGDRENQEDRYLSRWVGNGDLIALVADGMGGHPDGELAAGVGVRTVAAQIEALLQRRDADIPAGLRAAYGAGHQAVSKLHSPGWSLQPATTLVGGVFLQEQGVFHCANVGDGLSFLLHGDSIEHLARYCDLSYSLGYSLGSVIPGRASNSSSRSRWSLVTGSCSPATAWPASIRGCFTPACASEQPRVTPARRWCGWCWTSG